MVGSGSTLKEQPEDTLFRATAKLEHKQLQRGPTALRRQERQETLLTFSGE